MCLHALHSYEAHVTNLAHALPVSRSPGHGNYEPNTKPRGGVGAPCTVVVSCSNLACRALGTCELQVRSQAAASYASSCSASARSCGGGNAPADPPGHLHDAQPLDENVAQSSTPLSPSPLQGTTQLICVFSTGAGCCHELARATFMHCMQRGAHLLYWTAQGRCPYPSSTLPAHLLPYWSRASSSILKGCPHWTSGSSCVLASCVLAACAPNHDTGLHNGLNWPCEGTGIFRIKKPKPETPEWSGTAKILFGLLCHTTTVRARQHANHEHDVLCCEVRQCSS